MDGGIDIEGPEEDVNLERQDPMMLFDHEGFRHFPVADLVSLNKSL